MRAEFSLDVLWSNVEQVYNPAEYEVASKRFAIKLQEFCRVMADVDDRFKNLRRGKHRFCFADLAPEEAARLVSKDGYVISLANLTSNAAYVGLNVANGIGSVMPGSVRLVADDAFWQDEALIRRVAAAMIDFWQADQACVYTLRLADTEWRPDQPWHFWLDWRRTAGAPTLMPDVRASGEPAVVRAWHGGVERVWPEYAPWDRVTPRGTAPE